VVSTYNYDALNRNTTIDYSDTASINPDVTRVYDGATNGKGRLWKAAWANSQWQFYTYNADGQRTRRKLNRQRHKGSRRSRQRHNVGI
jgi:hypothetical protein